MIDQLLPPAPAASAQPRPSRGQAATPFDSWLAPPRQVASNEGIGDYALPPDMNTTKTAALAELGAAAQPFDAVFEFHLLGVDGGIEVIAVPWRLAGNGTLSHLSADPDPLSIQQLLQPGSSAASSSVQGPMFAPRIGGPSPWLPPGNLPSSTAAVPASGTLVRTLGQDVASLTGSASPASLVEPWLARLLRWIEQRGHDPVVWIRDYRLDDAASRNAVEEVRALALQQGWKLERIVVNGRQLWRAPHLSEYQEGSSCP